MHALLRPRVVPLRIRLSILLGGLALLMGCGGGLGPEPIASIKLEAPTSLVVGSEATVVVTAIGSRGSEPLAGFSGTVTFDVDDGAVSPSFASFVDGVASVPLRFEGVVAPVALTANVGSVTATAVVDLLPLAALPGDAASLAAAKIPFIGYRYRPQDFATGAPDLPGLTLSFNTVIAIVNPNASVGDLNDLLARHGAGIVGAVPGLDAVHGPILNLRLPTADHVAALAALTDLEADPLIAAVHRDHLLALPDASASGIGSSVISNPNGGVPASWTWELEDDEQPTPDGNWGLEYIRVPQMWNLNAFAASAPVNVGILDTNFPDHPDVEFAQRLGQYTLLDPTSNDHGLHVTGTIGATFRNASGIDGVHPFPDLVARRYGAGVGYGITDLIASRPDLRVINVSLGENWYADAKINPQTNAAAQAQMNAEGTVFAHYLEFLDQVGLPVPLFVVAAGNDSGRTIFNDAAIDARWSSAFTNAAIRNLTDHVIVVEAIDSTGGPWEHSNTNGTVSAPGDQILSASVSENYTVKSGTSMAAPHVTGVAAYLLSLYPTLTNAQIIEAITSTAMDAPIGDGPPTIDAFAAALAIDAIVAGNPTIIRELVDIDDGTLDGNHRTARTIDIDAETDGDYGPLGDGTIDMSDFRRWRDWLLQVEDGGDLALDGGADHPKKDPNGNREIEDADTENTFPRGDFNGDGQMTRLLANYVGGALNAELTDLEVLEAYFDDPHYEATELENLIDSGDLEIWTRQLLERPDVAYVVSNLVGTNQERTHTNADPRHVITAIVGTYTAEARAFNGSGVLVALETRDFTIRSGGDDYWDPASTEEPPIAVGVEASLEDIDEVRVNAFCPNDGGFVDDRHELVGVLASTSNLSASIAATGQDDEGNARSVSGTAAFSGTLDAVTDSSGAVTRVLGTGTGSVTVQAVNARSETFQSSQCNLTAAANGSDRLGNVPTNTRFTVSGTPVRVTLTGSWSFTAPHDEPAGTRNYGLALMEGTTADGSVTVFRRDSTSSEAWDESHVLAPGTYYFSLVIGSNFILPDSCLSCAHELGFSYGFELVFAEP